MPVLSPLNASFPDHFETRRQRLRSLLFRTDSKLHTVNVTSPDPGQWFAAAFTLDPHQRILQKDLFSPCEVFLSSSLTPYLLPEVIDLLPTQATSLRLVRPTYLRFASSREQWSLNFSLSECKLQGIGTADPCPVVVRATADVPPSAEEDVDVEVSRRTATVNCSASETGEPCRGTMVPAADGWSYILVEPTVPLDEEGDALESLDPAYEVDELELGDTCGDLWVRGGPSRAASCAGAEDQ
ncbi:post-GPI attachment to proteins factor 6-like [Haemaphysalis longicornis]